MLVIWLATRPKNSLEISIRMGICFSHDTTKNNIELGSGPDRPDEDTSDKGAPGRIDDNGRTLPGVSEEGREGRDQAEEINRLETASATVRAAADA